MCIKGETYGVGTPATPGVVSTLTSVRTACKTKNSVTGFRNIFVGSLMCSSGLPTGLKAARLMVLNPALRQVNVGERVWCWPAN